MGAAAMRPGRDYANQVTLRAGGISVNHNEALKLKSGLKAGKL